MEELISREKAIEEIKAVFEWHDTVTMERMIEHFNNLPSAQPETHEERTETHACDLISRKDAIRIVDSIDTWQAGWRGNAIESLKAMPSAQPDLDEVYAHAETEAEARFHAEIVRCKDCKHQVKEWRADKRLKDKGYMVCGCDVVGDACGYWALLGQDDDYCSYAERRTDEDD